MEDNVSSRPANQSMKREDSFPDLIFDFNPISSHFHSLLLKKHYPNSVLMIAATLPFRLLHLCSTDSAVTTVRKASRMSSRLVTEKEDEEVKAKMPCARSGACEKTLRGERKGESSIRRRAKGATGVKGGSTHRHTHTPVQPHCRSHSTNIAILAENNLLTMKDSLCGHEVKSSDISFRRQ